MTGDPTAARPTVAFYTDAEAFLADGAAYLAAHPLDCSVIATVADRARRTPAPERRPRWFALVRSGDDVIGAAMRTHPDPPHPGFIPRVSHEALDALAAALRERGDYAPAWNGHLDSARALCSLADPDVTPRVAMHTRLFEATDVTFPARPDGELRRATPEDLDVLTSFYAGFYRDSELQGGRVPDPDWTPDVAGIRARLDGDVFWLWEVAGRPVHLTGVQPAMFGVRRIGPVYTPEADRGHGYAGWVVAELTQRVLDAGQRACLYTDQANPTSNALYQRLGYRAVQDEGNVTVAPEADATAD